MSILTIGAVGVGTGTDTSETGVAAVETDPDTVHTEGISPQTVGPGSDATDGDIAAIGTDTDIARDLAEDQYISTDESLYVPRDYFEPIYVGESVAIGFLEDHGGDTYEWEVVNGDDDQLLHTSTAELSDAAPDSLPHDARATSFRPTEPGVYEIRAVVDGSDTYTAHIRVDREETPVAGQNAQELVQQHAPVLNFHPNERYYPTRYEAYVENSDLRTDVKRPDFTLIEGVTLTDIGVDYAPNRGSIIRDPRRATDRTTTHEENYLSPQTRGDDEHETYQQTVVADYYPETVYASVHENVFFDGEEYTAIGYWMVYIHDPKPEGEASSAVAAHTGDQEPVFVLVDDDGDPQWIAAQQHKGGELRSWERVETVEDRPVLYVAEGAHSNFLGPKGADGDEPVSEPDPPDVEYLYQDQFLCDGDRSRLRGCDGAGDAGELPDRRAAALYADPTADGFSASGDRWVPEVATNGGGDETYEITRLTGNESWSEYEGAIYRFPGRDAPLLPSPQGKIPMQQDRWETDSEADISLTRYIDSRADPEEQIEIHPDRDQIDGEIADIGETSYALNGTPNAQEITIENTGFKPQNYAITTRSDKRSGGETVQRHTAFVGTGEPDVVGVSAGVDPNERDIEVPLALSGDGTWDVVVELSVYPEDAGNHELEQRYELYSELFEVSSVDSGDLTITDVPDGTAGGTDTPRPVKVVVDMEEPDGDPFVDPIEQDRLDITVGDRTVDNRALVTRKAVGLYEIQFVPPTQPEGGEYNVTVSYDDVTDEEPDAINYAEGETTQLATSLQIDRSGSMSGIMSEARQGGVTFVEQATDEDYVSVVSYSGYSRVDQDLTRLGDGRQDVINSIEGLSASGSTNVGDAMIDGLDTLDDAPEGASKAGIHMTDGVRNSGPGEGEILNEIVPDYNEQDVCLYTIGFTSGADEQFMQDVAEASDCGDYRFAGESGEVDSIQDTLQAVFADLSGDVADADQLTSDEGVLGEDESQSADFGVDESVSQLTTNLRLENAEFDDIEASAADVQGASDEDAPGAAIRTQNVNDTGPVTLIRPDGSVVDTNDSDVEVSIVGDSVIYRIEDPAAGTWSYELRNEQPDASEFAVDITGDAQIGADVSTAGETYYVGEEIDITATLVGADGGVPGADIDAVVERPDGTNVSVSLAEGQSGVYAGTLTATAAGEYNVTVTAERETLSRIETTSWVVKEDPPISIAQRDTAKAVPGESTEFTVTVDQTGTDTEDSVTVDISDLSAVDGNDTVADERVGVEPRTVTLNEGEENVTATVDLPDGTTPGEYRGTARVFASDGGVVTAPITVTVLAPGEISVEFVETTETVETGENVEATVNVSNVGEVTEEGSVIFSIPESGQQSETVALDGGESVSQNFTVSADEPGEYTVQVISRAGDDTTTLDVLGPAEFGTSIVGTLSETDVEPGDDVTVNATVGNLGDEPDTQTVSFSVDNETVAERTVELDPDQLETFEFTYGTDRGDDGAVAAVTTEDDRSETTLTVREDRSDLGVGTGSGILVVQTSVIPDADGAIVEFRGINESQTLTADLAEELDRAPSDEHIRVRSITLDAATSIDVVKYDLFEPSAEPRTAPALDDETVIGYVPIERERPAADPALETASITFELEASGLPESADFEDVTVYHAGDQTWSQVETSHRGSGIFRVNASNPATLAVTVDPDPGAEGEEPNSEEEMSDSEDESPERPTQPESEAPDEEVFAVPGFGAVITVLSLLIASLVARRVGIRTE
ncbi:VWA domain-containing protein [Halorubrum salipaludis]|uniref:VWA domain-containing protein n=1 Tax=Halorubrum salipaludis TaxID=2032630 RepID=UPI0013045D45|nr:VWA domain-containing protein [Halorubrum salipaludis]